MLRKVGHYNDVGAMPVLPKKGTLVSYRFISLEFDHVTKKALYPHQVTLPPTSNYFDPKTEEWKKVGLVESIDKDGLIRVTKVRCHPQQDAGHLNIIIGESTYNDNLYQYLEMASFVDHGDGRMRDENEPLILVKVDHDAEARAKREARKLRTDAMIAARQLEGAELIQAALVLGVFSPTLKEDAIRESVEEIAERKPAHFFEVLEDPQAEAKAAMQHAILLGVVKKVGNLIKWTQTGGDLMQLTGDENIAFQFAQYVSTSDHGEKILAELKRQVSKAAGKKPAPAPQQQPPMQREPEAPAAAKANKQQQGGSKSRQQQKDELPAANTSTQPNNNGGEGSNAEENNNYSKGTQGGGLDELVFGNNPS